MLVFWEKLNRSKVEHQKNFQVKLWIICNTYDLQDPCRYKDASTNQPDYGWRMAVHMKKIIQKLSPPSFPNWQICASQMSIHLIIFPNFSRVKMKRRENIYIHIAEMYIAWYREILLQRWSQNLPIRGPILGSWKKNHITSPERLKTSKKWKSAISKSKTFHAQPYLVAAWGNCSCVFLRMFVVKTIVMCTAPDLATSTNDMGTFKPELFPVLWLTSHSLLFHRKSSPPMPLVPCDSLLCLFLMLYYL